MEGDGGWMRIFGSISKLQSNHRDHRGHRADRNCFWFFLNRLCALWLVLKCFFESGGLGATEWARGDTRITGRLLRLFHFGDDLIGVARHELLAAAVDYEIQDFHHDGPD